MEKGESIISVALSGLLVLVALGAQRRWNTSTLRSMAASAENFVLRKTGLRGSLPGLPGYERVSAYWLGKDKAALYRATPAPLVFASYRFVVFNSTGALLFATNTLEATSQPWSRLYDFAGRHGIPDLRLPGGPSYTRNLTGDGSPDILLGQYSGGDHCCTTVTVIELAKGEAHVIGKIEGLDGMPFEGLDVRRLAQHPGWELVAHRPYHTSCGVHADAPDIISVYAYQNGQFSTQTRNYPAFLGSVLKSNLAKWRSHRSLHLLQSVTADYSILGQPGVGETFFRENFPSFLPQLANAGIDPQACTEDVMNLAASLASNTLQN